MRDALSPVQRVKVHGAARARCGPAHGRWRDGVFAIGNAAGELHPIVGGGIAAAIESAALLCEAIVAGGSDEQVARRYAAAWRSRFARRHRVSALLAGLAMRPWRRPPPEPCSAGVLRS